MKYLSTAEIAVKWNISKRSVRDYCNKGRVIGAILKGKTWQIPEDALMPKRQTRTTNKTRKLLDVLKEEKGSKLSGGIYHKLQIEMTYNTNHIEGSKLNHEQTRHIFETKTISAHDESLKIDDIIECVNHFRCIDLAIESAKTKLSESLIKQFHYILKFNTSDQNKPWFKIGDYKLLPNEVGGSDTCSPNQVKEKIIALLKKYNSLIEVTIEDIIDFHYEFEKIHPFQDGNGRVGRLIVLKECLKHNIVPFIITDNIKDFYYRGLKEYPRNKGYLIDTCLYGQDIVKSYLDYFKIEYK